MKYSIGAEVRVVVPGDPFTGRVGAVERTYRDDDIGLVHVVRFCGDRDAYPHHTAYYLSDEIRSATASPEDVP